MNADEILARALHEGQVARGRNVGAQTFPGAARTYLADGTGLAWMIPPTLTGKVTFAVDAETVAPVRQSLRRYGVTDPEKFASAWTQAEVWAKLYDIPIITWLTRHGLNEPDHVRHARNSGAIASTTRRDGDVIITFGARNSGVVGGAV